VGERPGYSTMALGSYNNLSTAIWKMKRRGGKLMVAERKIG